MGMANRPTDREYFEQYGFGVSRWPEADDTEFAVLAMLDQPLLTVEEDGDHEHTGIPCRTCVALGLPRNER